MLKLSKIFAEIKMERLVECARAYPRGSSMRHRAAQALISYGDALPEDKAVVAIMCAGKGLVMARDNDFVSRDAMVSILRKADAAFERDQEATLAVLKESMEAQEYEHRDFMPLLQKQNQLLYFGPK